MLAAKKERDEAQPGNRRPQHCEAAKAAVARHEIWVKSALAPQEVEFLIHLLQRLNRRPAGAAEAEPGEADHAVMELLG